MTRVIHTGQALVDLIVEVPALPPRGGNTMASSFGRYAGGAVSVLVAAARSGAHTVHAGSHGTGPNGDLVRTALEHAGVRWSSPPVPDEDTGVCVVLVEPSAERTFVTTLGAERRITAAGLGAAQPVAGDLVCVTGYSLLAPTVAPLADWLGRLPPTVRVVLDPGAAFAGLDAGVRDLMMRHTGIWTSNAAEAAELTGVARVEDATRALGQMLPEGAQVVVRDGPAGCYLLAGQAVTHVPGYPQRAVDTNGAGDAHTGVLVAELAAGTSLGESARRANAAAAIKVTRRGAATAPGREEIDAFLLAGARGALQ